MKPMPSYHKPISEYGSRKEWSAKMWDRLREDIRNPGLADTLDSLLSSYEKNIIVHRIAAVALLQKGKPYRQIGRELWLSSSTIRSLKRTIEYSAGKSYESYRTVAAAHKGSKAAKRNPPVETPLMDWISYCISVFPQKHGPRWRITGGSSRYRK